MHRPSFQGWPHPKGGAYGGRLEGPPHRAGFKGLPAIAGAPSWYANHGPGVSPGAGFCSRYAHGVRGPGFVAPVRRLLLHEDPVGAALRYSGRPHQRRCAVS